jgi:hypothetical protein
VIEVDIASDLLPRHAQALRALAAVSNRVSVENWALVGGLMVLVLSREAGSSGARSEATRDADVVIDVVARPTAVGEVAQELTSQGFTLTDAIGSGDAAARCSFTFGAAQVDLLCSDEATDDQLVVDDGVRSIAMPGGRTALRHARLVSVRYSDEYPDATIQVPTLLGGVLTKAAAALDPRTSWARRHADDTVHLLSLIEPFVAANTLRTVPEDVETLTRFAGLVDEPVHPAWTSGVDQQLVRAALRTMLG